MRRVWPWLVVAIGSLACSGDSPTGPSDGGRVSADQVIEGSLSGADSSDNYSFLALAGHSYSLSFEASVGVVSVDMRDSVSGTLLIYGFDNQGGAGLDQNITFDFRPTADQVVLLRVSSATFPTNYRVRINAVPTAPEGRAARFAFGDTVTEELSSSFDLDEFVATGQAGQEIVVFAEAVGSFGSGQIVIEVYAPGSADLFTQAVAVAGDPTLSSAEVVTLPASGDYRFLVWGIPINNHRYTGSYRLRVLVVHRAPESISATVPFNTPITGEAIGDPGDIDEFTFAGTAGQWFNAFIQSSAPPNLFLETFGPATDPVPSYSVSIPTDTSLFKHATGSFRIVTNGSYGLRVRSLNLPSVVAPYRLFLYHIDPAPELVAAPIVAGDTVDGETIEHAGDFDEFTFTGAAGSEYNAFFQALSGHGALRLDVVTGADSVVGSVNSAGTDTSMRQTTGRFTVPTSGTHIVRVQGVSSTDGDYTGAYRFMLVQVNPNPELGPNTLVFGDSVDTETIGVPGDRDEWSFTVPDSSGANLVVQLGNDARDGTLRAELVNSAGVTVALTDLSVPNSIGASGAVALAPGQYKLSVDPTRYYERSLMSGSYRLWLYRFKLGPETAPDTIAIGDTVSETSAPPGDVDAYSIFGTVRQPVTLAIQGIAGQPGAAFGLNLTSLTGTPIGYVASPSISGSLDDNQTNRIDLPVTRWYRASVNYATVPAPGFFDPGTYRFAVRLYPTQPETAPTTLALGDSVVTEAVDTRGDWDEYFVNATPGTEAAVLFYRLATPHFPRVLVMDSVSGDSLSGIPGNLGVHAAGPFVVPASGKLRVAVFDDQLFYDYTGGYFVRVVPVNRGPEIAAATFATGDTVRGESLDPIADLDEFMATGTPGQPMSPFIRLLADAQPAGRVITLEVIDPSTGSVLVGSNAGVITASTTFFSPGTFVVPAGGMYRVRIRAGSLFPDEVATAPYEFFVRAGP